MRILLWHGYLLTGTGSNLYTANVARQWRAAGHDVLVLCQDRVAAALSFIDEAGDFSPANDSFELRPTDAPAAAGRARVVRPSIGPVLPVYVFDHYEGFSARLFVELSDRELDDYTRANVVALVTAIDRHRPEAIVTGHEVMGPYIALQASMRTGAGYLAKLHGSGLEYAVKKQQRYRRFAVEGLAGAKVVVGGSRYMVEEVARTIPGFSDHAVVVNPGCDTELFKPGPAAPKRGPVAGYVGKLIAAKGVHHFLAALGLTDVPSLEARLVGFGGDEDRFKSLASALAAGDRVAAVGVAQQSGEREAGCEFGAWLQERPDAYFRRAARVPVTWLGRLDHEALAQVLPGWDVLCVPSVVPEAFGMVASEAAACGVPPIVPRHSGIGEVGAVLEDAIGRPGMLSYAPDDPITGLARALQDLVRLEPAEREAIAAAVGAVARERWSWRTVAERLLELAAAT